MTTKMYEEYAVLNAQIKTLTDKRDELKVQIIEDLAEEGMESITTAVGKFTITNLKTWKYTDKVKELEEKYKAQKATEESTGDATFEVKPSLRFTQIKL
jgi:ACT domain-containing protein